MVKLNMEYLDRKRLVNLLDRLIEKGSAQQYALFLKKYHEADIAEALEELSFEKQYKFFVKIKPEISVEILEEMDLEKQVQLISFFKTDVAANYIKEMEPDDAVDLLEELFEADEEKVSHIIEALPVKEARDIKGLLSYNEDSAGTVMTTEFLAVPERLTVKEALASIKKQDPPESEVSFYIFVLAEDRRLIGYTSLRDLLLSDVDKKVAEIKHDYKIKVYVDTDLDEVVRSFRKYSLAVFPVVDRQEVLVGIITADDVVDLVVKEATEDIYKLSGTSEEAEESKLISGKVSYALKSRLPWLLLTIVGGLVSVYIINIYSQHFNSTLFSLSLSLSFIPVLMGLGGNVGNQSATIMVRGMSTGVVKDEKAWKYIYKEMLVGTSIGVIVGVILFLFNLFLAKQSLLFSSIVALSMFFNIFVAAFIGTSFPIFLKRISVDPAVASAPFIATTLDIFGQIIYFILTFVFLFFIVS